MFKYFLFAIYGLMLSGCDFDKSDVSTSWKCTEVIAQNKVLCQKGKQSVTVTLDCLLVPGAVDSSAKSYIFEHTSCSSGIYEKCSAEALKCVTELALNQSVKIVPEPAPDQIKLTAQIFTSRGSDIAEILIKEGLVLVKKNNSSGSYSQYQKQAINLERGIWKSSKIYSDIFNIDATVDITVDEDKEQQKRTIKGLRRFHSPDLIRAPLLRSADTSKEVKSMVLVNCKANISIKIKPPPKEYELTIFFRPLARANIYSGPLDSFKNNEMGWEEKFINAKGGDSIETELKYELLDLSLVTRGGTKVYSGYIVEGYEIEITTEDETIYKKTGEFPNKEIFEKLEKSEKSVF